MFEQFLVQLESSPAFLLSVVTILSLMVGSFLNVLIYRLPVMMKKEWECDCRDLLVDELEKKKRAKGNSSEPFNLFKPDSHCPKCKAKVKPWQNIPVFSYLLLRGRCGNCQHPISLRYPAIELLTAVTSFVVAWYFGYSPQTLILVPLTWIFISLIFIDIDHMLLPDRLTMPLLWLVLLSSIWGVFQSPKDALIGATAGYLSLWSVYWGFKLLTGKEGMGYGDFKLLAIVGAVVGWIKLPMVILLSSAVGAVVGISLMIAGKANRSSQIPFGPYIAIAGWIAMVWGDGILNWYLGALA